MQRFSKVIAINFGSINIRHKYNIVAGKVSNNPLNYFIKEKVKLSLYLASDSNLAKIGSMGIIKEISEMPKVLFYANDKVRDDLTNAGNDSLHSTYLVDVEITLKNSDARVNHDNIQQYEILKLHK